MYHTFCMARRLTPIESERYFNSLKKYSKRTESKLFPIKKTKTYIMIPKNRKGIIWYFKSSNNGAGFSYYSIEAKINPKVFSGNGCYIAVSTEEDLERINTALQNECREIFGISHTLSDFDIRRIDYCINFDVKDSGLEPDKVIQLIKRADKPARFDVWEKYHRKSGRKKPGEFSYYLINDSLHINCYYKYKQLENEFSDYTEIESSRHIIRFEIQMLPQKVYQMKKSIEEPENINEALLSDDYCMEMLLKYYKKTIGYGNYTTLYNAVKIVEASDFKQNRKQKIIETLKLINEKRSIYKARESLKTKKEIDNFNKALKKLQELKLNGVTIPEGWRVQLFKNPIYSLFKPIQGNDNSSLKDEK